MTTATARQNEPGQHRAVCRTESARVGPIFAPHVDILETVDELTLVADVPGAGSDDIEVQYEQGELSIRARVSTRQAQETRFVLREYGVGEYHRAFQLGESIDSSRIHAEVTEGVLTVHLPKVEKVKPQKITVRSA